MASISTGYSFGATELVTSTKLNNAVNNATLSLVVGIPFGTTTPAAGCFTSATATGGRFSSLSGSAITASAFCLAQASKSATAAASSHSAFTLDHYFNINVNGITLYIPCATATA